MKAIKSTLIISFKLNEQEKITGYDIELPENATEEQKELIGRIRDMYFWDNVKYDGRESDSDDVQTVKLKFKTGLYTGEDVSKRD